MISATTLGGAAVLYRRQAALFLTTSLIAPPGMQVRGYGDTHSGFLGDGERYLVADVGPKVVERWLSDEPPWGNADWKPGPVPAEIGFHCSFGFKGLSVTTSVTSAEYHGPTELTRILSSRNVSYAARARGPQSMRWHNGDLLILEPQSGALWLSSWDW
jgi:hypothetical protein